MVHLQENGYEVLTQDVSSQQLSSIKKQNGVTQRLSSCHTAIVEGYVLEGHVPADDIARLLEERPDARGLAVPGMPRGSPGMEGPQPEPYDVLLFDSDGKTTVYESH